MVEKKKSETVCFIYLTVGHTKFAPDRLFSSIAKTFYNSDIFCIEMLNNIVQQYATSHVFISSQIKQWRASLEQKYSGIQGISEMHDICISKNSGKFTVSHRKSRLTVVSHMAKKNAHMMTTKSLFTRTKMY